MSAMASQMTSVSMVCLIVCSDGDPRKHQTSAVLAFVGEFTSHRLIPPQRASNAQNVFNLMTSSWIRLNVLTLEGDTKSHNFARPHLQINLVQSKLLLCFDCFDFNFTDAFSLMCNSFYTRTGRVCGEQATAYYVYEYSRTSMMFKRVTVPITFE